MSDLSDNDLEARATAARAEWLEESRGPVASDRDRLLALLSDFGIKPSEGSNARDYTENHDNPVFLEAYEGNVRGYNGFFCVFEFADDGTFKQVGVWE